MERTPIVTITGADDRTNPADLFALSARYPFVEWGILFSQKRAGEPRYPASAWFNEFVSAADVRKSLHLCGRASRVTIAGCSTYLDLAVRCGFDRVQLNGWKFTENPRHFVESPVELILQSMTLDGFQRACADVRMILNGGGRASALYDPSGGRGIFADLVEVLQHGTGDHYGYAGGINPANVTHMLQRTLDQGGYWIDMESGVRDQVDWFDLGKVRSVLASCEEVLLAEGLF